MNTAQKSDSVTRPATANRKTLEPKTDVLLKGLGHGVFEIGLGSPGVAILAEVLYTLRALQTARRDVDGEDLLDVENAVEAAHLRLHAGFELIFTEMNQYKKRATEAAAERSDAPNMTSHVTSVAAAPLHEHIEYLRACLVEAKENAQRLLGVLVMGADDDLGFGEENVASARKIGAGLGCNIDGALCELATLGAKLEQSNDVGGREH